MSIISPWIFYIIDLLDKLQTTCIVALLGCVFFLFVSMISDFAKIKKVIITTIICVLGVVAIPSEETMYKMLVAKYVTYENIDKATESIKDGVDYIFEKLDKE